MERFRIKKRISSFILTLLLCLEMAVPAFAAGGSERDITWLTVEGKPCYYNRKLN